MVFMNAMNGRSAGVLSVSQQVLGVEARLRELQDVLVDDSKADDGAAAPSSPSKRPVDMKAILSAAQAAKELRRTHAKSSRRLAVRLPYCPVIAPITL